MRIVDRPEYKSKPKPLTGSATDTVRDGAVRMAESNYGSIIVVDEENKVAGIVTERDIYKKIVAKAADPNAVSLGDIMTREVRVARETDDLVDWLRLMSNERFRRVPVVDENGSLVSVMSQGDFVSYTWPDLIRQAQTLVSSTAGKGFNPIMIMAGILVYTIILIVAVRAIL